MLGKIGLSGNIAAEEVVPNYNFVLGTVVSVAIVIHTAVLVLRLRVRVLSLPIFEYLPQWPLQSHLDTFPE